jgi:hypothetical protein
MKNRLLFFALAASIFASWVRPFSAPQLVGRLPAPGRG